MKLFDNLYLEAVTDKILRIHSKQAVQKESFALGGEIPAEGNLQEQTVEGNLQEQTKERVFKTSFLELRVSEEGAVRIYDHLGRLLCSDYTGERKQPELLSEEEIDQMRQEGHLVQSGAEACSFQVFKELEGDEVIYGLGDKTGFLNKKGYDYMMWNSDNPEPQVENPKFKAMYKSIPFFIVLKNGLSYGIFLDNPYRSYFDMGFESREYYSFGAAKGELDYYFIAGDSIREVITGYTLLTGRAPLPQMWTLGYHQSRWSYASEEEVLEIADNFRKHGIPCDAIHLDIDYMDDFKVFTVDRKKFPDLKAMSERLAEMGIKLVMNVDPGTKVEEGYDVYEEGIQKGYFAKAKDGTVYENVVWPGDAVFPDYTSQEVRDWWGGLTGRVTSQGIRGLWNDMNEPASFKEPLPEDVVFAGDGKERLHEEVHNVYGHLMAKATYEGLKKSDGRRPFVITRACFSGTQKYATAWTGDNQSLWAHLQMSVPQLLNLGMSGMPFVGTDIGGFGANTTPELLSRWIEASCFAPLFRNHSAKYTRRQEPWQFDEETLRINRKYIKLHYKFLPYLYDLCREESLTGLPILRPLVMHYQRDRETWECNDEYLVGDSILVAPVMTQGARIRTIYLPEGVWVDYWTGERIAGKCYIMREAPLDICPIYIKAGSILPVYENLQSIEPETLNKLTLEYYPYRKATRFGVSHREGVILYQHYQDNGTDFAYQDGEYNLYEFAFSGENRKGIQVKMLHEGYEKKYKEIKAVIR